MSALAREAARCEWKPHRKTLEEGLELYFKTGCDVEYQSLTLPDEEDGFIYCPYCGKKIDYGRLHE